MAKFATPKVTKCTCEMCLETFRMDPKESLRHVFRTQGGRMLVLCHCCMEVARLHERAWKALRGATDRDEAEAA